MKKLLFFFLFIWFFSYATQAQKFVLDEGNYLTPTEEKKLEQKLKNYNDSTSTQIAIRTIDSLSGVEIEEYAINLATQLGIGQKEKDNGVLIVLAKKERKIRIETGYGLEHRLTDIKSKRMIRDILAPNLKNNQNFEALNLTIHKIFELLEGEFTNQNTTKDLLKTYQVTIQEELMDCDFISKTNDVFTWKQVSKINTDLKLYAKKSKNYIWILVGRESFYSVAKEIQEVFEQLQTTFPNAKNYTLLYLKPSRGMGSCGGCTQDELNTTLLFNWQKLPPKISSEKMIQDKFKSDIFNYYFAGLNPYGDTWFYPGLNQTIYLLKNLQDEKIGLDGIKPSFWYARENKSFIESIPLFIVFTIPFILVIVMIILKKTGGIPGFRLGGANSISYGNSGSSSNFSSSSGNSSNSSSDYSGGSYDGNSGGYSGGSSSSSSSGGSFGGGSFGGGGASGDY